MEEVVNFIVRRNVLELFLVDEVRMVIVNDFVLLEVIDIV